MGRDRRGSPIPGSHQESGPDVFEHVRAWNHQPQSTESVTMRFDRIDRPELETESQNKLVKPKVLKIGKKRVVLGKFRPPGSVGKSKRGE